jgi:mRNA-degrading endonuclease toxin of MazEF toxin-antitoxin module
MRVEQWDVVRFRIRPDDRDLHPAVVISAPEWCLDPARSRLNVLACSKRLPAEGPKAHQVVLNGADGLDFQTVCGCEFLHVVTRESLTDKIGRVCPVRRREIGRKLNEVLRLPL